MTGYVAGLSWKSGAPAIEKLDRLRSTMAVNVLTFSTEQSRVAQKSVIEIYNCVISPILLRKVILAKKNHRHEGIEDRIRF